LGADHVRQLDGPARDSTKPTSADAPLAQGGCEEALTTRSRRRALPLGAQSEPTATWRQLPPARLVRAGEQLDGPARDSTKPNERRCAFGARRMRGGADHKIKEASFASWGTKRADGDVASAAPCPACPGRGSIFYSVRIIVG